MKSQVVDWTFLFLLIFMVFWSTAHSQGLNSTCKSSDFPCRIDNGATCIPRQKWQDGVSDCPDGSDEECLAWQYDCKFGSPRCVNLFQLDDGQIDCATGFDEGCPAHFFVCLDMSECIDPMKYLDGNNDCKDASDEPCPSAHFLCHDRSQCIPMDKFQNGEADCADASDEECTLFQFECPCGPKRCIGVSKYGDGIEDCQDGADELSNHRVQLDASYKCSDGSLPRSLTVLAPIPPPGAPMVPCAATDVNVCSKDLGEMCLIIGGAPRCLCQMGLIRPPGAPRCIKASHGFAGSGDALTAVRSLAIGGSAVISTAGSSISSSAVASSNPAVFQQHSIMTSGALRGGGDRSVGIIQGEIGRDTPIMPPDSGEVVTLIRHFGGGPPFIQAQGTVQGIKIVQPKQDGAGSYLPAGLNILPPGYETAQSRDAVSEQIARDAGSAFVGLTLDQVLSQHRQQSSGSSGASFSGSSGGSFRQGSSGSSSGSFTQSGSSSSSNGGLSNCLGCTGTVTKFQLGSGGGVTGVTSGSSINRILQGQPLGFLASGASNAGQASSSTQTFQLGQSGGSGGNAGQTSTSTRTFQLGSSSAGGSNAGQTRSSTRTFQLGQSGGGASNAGQTSTSTRTYQLGSSGGRGSGSGSSGRSITHIIHEQPIILPPFVQSRSSSSASGSSSGSGFGSQAVTHILQNQPVNGILVQEHGTSGGIQGASGSSHSASARGSIQGASGGFRSGSGGFQSGASGSFLGTNGRFQGASGTFQQGSNQIIGGQRVLVSDVIHQSRGSGSQGSQNIQRVFIHDTDAGALQADSNTLASNTRVVGGLVQSVENNRLDRTISHSVTCGGTNKGRCPTAEEECVETLGLYSCGCRDGFVRDPSSAICIRMVNECSDVVLSNCDANAICMDNPLSYECLCREGYIDMSPIPQVNPGRKCLPLINECASENECSSDAECLDLPGGYTCRCKTEFQDISPDRARKPGRICKRAANECVSPLTHSCDPRAICTDRDDGYSCRCRSGFVDISPDPVNLPGRKCAELINECLDSSLNNCDRTGAECSDTPEGYLCRCLAGYRDETPSLPGRTCKATSTSGNNPCFDYSLHDCDNNAICESSRPGFFECRCPKGFVDTSPDYRYPGRKCTREEDECSLGKHNCDVNAHCLDTKEGFDCQCFQGFLDNSPDPARNPGRVCRVNSANVCSATDCSPESECRVTDRGPRCQCRSGFFDTSFQYGRQPGRVCQRLQNECQNGQHDCSSSAHCIDSADSFTCTCFDGFRDDSPDPNTPGRNCVKYNTLPASECNVNDPLSCDETKFEVCNFVGGVYKCQCPKGITRLPDGRCKVQNECGERRLNDCALEAQCIDQAEGYTCQCQLGFTDISVEVDRRPGRICRPLINECTDTTRYNVDCDAVALCVDTEESFACRCRPGYADVSESYNRLPGRRCVEAVNECQDRISNDCSQNAVCDDEKEGYTCKCRDGFVDASPNPSYPGRVCNKPEDKDQGINTQFQLDPCDPNRPNCNRGEVCTDIGDARFVCECPKNSFRFHDGSCKVLAACDDNLLHDCDEDALCSNYFNDYECQCRPGFLDISPDPIQKPGRKCSKLRNECQDRSLHNCSPFGDCIDTREGYTCVCQDQYVDISSEMKLPPGRQCVNASNECAARSLQTCDDNADCVNTPGGYACQCADGFIDVSSNAGLPPGRSCTLQTACPKQPTDLMFLVDGSGSIGSRVFRDEVLRFLREFVELFDIGLTNTRVGVIQYSDQIRHEFDLNHYTDKVGVLRGISEVEYLTGLTRTGAAIQHMVQEGFSIRRGARPLSSEISRVGIVITDGRSQDNVTAPAERARKAGIKLFAIGVTTHVLDTELQFIAGVNSHYFHVNDFTDLNTRLRSLIQKATCPVADPVVEDPGACDPATHKGCNRARNEICREVRGRFECACPDEYQRNPVTAVCGGDLCNPNLPTTCRYPEECRRTPFANHRCSCPGPNYRQPGTGACVDVTATAPPVYDCRVGDISSCPDNQVCMREPDGLQHCVCSAGLVKHPKNGKCMPPNSCLPSDPKACDPRKKEVCRPLDGSPYHTCQCGNKFRRHEVTGVCLLNECISGQHECNKFAKCSDTDDGYICSCGPGFIDQSPDVQNKPGRVCAQEINECKRGSHKCSRNAFCINTEENYICQCKRGYVDLSQNRQKNPGIICKQLVDECRTNRNDCSNNAECIDTVDSYKCFCKSGFVDEDNLRNPGRTCEKEANELCKSGKNDCDPQAQCFPVGIDDFTCSCPAQYKDRSADPAGRPGRVCVPVIPECDNPALNDCDSPDRADCIDTDDSYQCFCKNNFLDISPDPNKPGRLCKKLIDECRQRTHDCARDGGVCTDTPDSFSCSCGHSYLDVSPDPINRPGRACKRLTDECAIRRHDCSPNAECSDTEDSYICRCLENYIDKSSDPINRPGRICIELIDECTTNRHDCSPNSDCQDTPEAYRCQCRPDFVDQSRDQFNRPGRICRPRRVDECALEQDDCGAQAVCLDREDGFTCRCNDGFFDDSLDRITKPGRVCRAKPTEPPPECRLDLINSCDDNLKEVCRLVRGEPKCTCPENYRRNPRTNACTMINECLFRHLQDCSANSHCQDLEDGFTCKCRDGFLDKSPDPDNRPGRVCRPLINECRIDYLNDCHQFAECQDLEEGYTCRCRTNYQDLSPDPQVRAGRICRRVVNECEDTSLNTCSSNAHCNDELEGYQCRCHDGYIDISPTPGSPGRACKEIVNECAHQDSNDCHKLAVCTDTLDSYRCECPTTTKDISPNLAFPGRVCLELPDECALGLHDCHESAICRDTEDAFTCECAAGWVDRSPNPLSRPGRVCVRLLDECDDGTAQCSPKAECRDLEDGYACECRNGFVDRSPDLSQPGRVCSVPAVCPSNHACSSAAICEPLGGGDYKCTCIQGYVDHSPNPSDIPGTVCVRVLALSGEVCKGVLCSPQGFCDRDSVCQCSPGFHDASPDVPGTLCLSDHSVYIPRSPKDNECRDPKQNDCSRNAICYDLPVGYRCECVQGYEDRSRNASRPGRICEPLAAPTPPPKHPCQDPNRNDCSVLGFCRSLASDTDDYTCECPKHYLDRSPDPVNNPGRVCVTRAKVCLDPGQNDCHQFAICTPELDSRKFTCRCRDGYVDRSNDNSKPGRICKEVVNECLDARLNDCDSIALCEDTNDGYQCKCPPQSLDLEPIRPGRHCRPLTNECANPQLNNCSRFADCIDQQRGYQCQCRTGYYDNDPTQPGRKCGLIINECETTNLNDCHRHAECIDLPGSYQCRCKVPHKDISYDPVNEPGRLCRLDECNNPRDNDCARDAVCMDTDDSYLCYCKQGFNDVSNPKTPGRKCQRIRTQPIFTTTSAPEGGRRCGLDNWCFPEKWNEICVAGGTRCACQLGMARKRPNTPCVAVEEIILPLRVIRRNQNTLFWSTEYGNPDSPRYIELVDIFSKGINKAVESTDVEPQFITSGVNYMAPPRLYNSSWQEGLMFNFSCYVKPGSVQPRRLWETLLQSIVRTGYSIGGTELYIDPHQLNPFQAPVPDGLRCGSNICKEELGEVCVAQRTCACRIHQRRRGPGQPCLDVEAFSLTLWVVRKGFQNLRYNSSFANPADALQRSYVDLFNTGIGNTYKQTQMSPYFITSEVNDILEPLILNGTWGDTGILYNFTCYFMPGQIRNPSNVWDSLIHTIIQRFQYSVGGTDLFINPYQANPFSSCYRSDCHPKAWCIPRGPNSYTCQCPPDYLDKDPSLQGRKCIPKIGYNECIRAEDNQCSSNARCIDLELLYRCQCLPGFVNASPKGEIEGSVCVRNYCADVDFCPTNTTCVNEPGQARCSCEKGYEDIRQSPRRAIFGLNQVWCMATRDINECDLGLTNCSAVANCRDLINGYDCSCPSGYSDGNPSIPGRVCAARQCDKCHRHGDCVHDERTRDVSCRCHNWYTGDRCERDIRVILAIILAILFLLITMCCLLYFCLKCRCVKGKGLWYREPLFTYRKGAWPWSTLQAHSTSSESNADFSAMSSAFGKGSDYYPDMAIPRAKLGKREQEQHRYDSGQLASYLDSDVRIPRAHISRASSVDRDLGDHMLYQDHITSGRRNRAYSETDTSDSSSVYTLQEEIERRVITDVKKVETHQTVAADLHNTSSNSRATAQFNVYPPVETNIITTSSTKKASLDDKQGRKWPFASSKSSSNHQNSNLHQEQNRDETSIYESARYPGPQSTSRKGGMSERDRGQSITEVSVAGMQAHNSDWGGDSASFSQNRAMSEITERDLDSISEESRSHGSNSDVGEEVFDKKVLVKKSHDYVPDPRGRGGTERYSNSVTTRKVTNQTNRS